MVSAPIERKYLLRAVIVVVRCEWPKTCAAVVFVRVRHRPQYVRITADESGHHDNAVIMFFSDGISDVLEGHFGPSINRTVTVKDPLSFAHVSDCGAPIANRKPESPWIPEAISPV